jgi:hypothetical protein
MLIPSPSNLMAKTEYGGQRHLQHLGAVSHAGSVTLTRLDRTTKNESSDDGAISRRNTETSMS